MNVFFFQDIKALSNKVAYYLCGKHKLIWHPETDCGDHVVVVNTRLVAMHGFDWKHTLFHFDRVGLMRWETTVNVCASFSVIPREDATSRPITSTTTIRVVYFLCSHRKRCYSFIGVVSRGEII